MNPRGARLGQRAARRGGFTLLEVLVALVIVGLALGALSGSVGAGLGNARISDDYIEAARRAQSRIDLIGMTQPVVPGTWSGSDGGGYAWRLVVSGPLGKTVPSDNKQPVFLLYQAEITLSWQRGAKSHQVVLRTKCLAAAAKNG